jgi:hypothetical protein
MYVFGVCLVCVWCVLTLSRITRILLYALFIRVAGLILAPESFISLLNGNSANDLMVGHETYIIMTVIAKTYSEIPAF